MSANIYISTGEFLDLTSTIERVLDALESVIALHRGNEFMSAPQQAVLRSAVALLVEHRRSR